MTCALKGGDRDEIARRRRGVARTFEGRDRDDIWRELIGRRRYIRSTVRRGGSGQWRWIGTRGSSRERHRDKMSLPAWARHPDPPRLSVVYLALTMRDNFDKENLNVNVNIPYRRVSFFSRVPHHNEIVMYRVLLRRSYLLIRDSSAHRNAREKRKICSCSPESAFFWDNEHSYYNAILDQTPTHSIGRARWQNCWQGDLANQIPRSKNADISTKKNFK